MSEISEECYYAGWLNGTEYFVPELCRRARDLGKSQTWGHGEVGPQKAEELFKIAELLGHWVDLDEMGSGYDPHDPFPIPPE